MAKKKSLKRKDRLELLEMIAELLRQNEELTERCTAQEAKIGDLEQQVEAAKAIHERMEKIEGHLLRIEEQSAGREQEAPEPQEEQEKPHEETEPQSGGQELPAEQEEHMEA